MTSLSKKFHPSWVISVALAAGACTAVGSGTDELSEAENASGGDGDLSAGMGDGDSEDPLVLGGDDSSGGGAGGASSEACVTLMSWGSVAQMGAVPGQSGMDAIVSWLNEASNASGAHFAQKPEITADFLEAVDVVLLQDLSTWDVSDAELTVFKTWVKEGGGVMALSGYGTDGVQVSATNRLLSFSGMNFVPSSQGALTATYVSECAPCLGTTYQQRGFNPEHPISFGIDALGAFEGRVVSGDGQIVAQIDDQVFAMTKEVGQGRALLFHDEWISYRTEWDKSAPAECAQNLACAEASPDTTYQVAQFWYNSIKWLAPDATCFDIEDESIAR